jgi:hypothetical protein
MAETIGSLTDKIIIVELKRFHMHEQTMRQDVTADHGQACQLKLAVLTQQRDDLVEELNQLFQEVMAGTNTLKVYRQFKMYNDPTYRLSMSSKQ